MRRLVQTITTPGALSAEDVINLAGTNAGSLRLRPPHGAPVDAPQPHDPCHADRAHATRDGQETISFALIVPCGVAAPRRLAGRDLRPTLRALALRRFLAADRNASRGVATIAIDAYGHAAARRASCSHDRRRRPWRPCRRAAAAWTPTTTATSPSPRA
jgi:hypothetical protein